MVIVDGWKMNSIRFSSIVIMLVTAFSSGCSAEKKISTHRIDGNFHLKRGHAGFRFIVDADGYDVVLADIKEWKILAHHVVGRIEPLDPYPLGSPPPSGYFILDLKTSEVKDGLQWEEWREIIKGLYGENPGFTELIPTP